jgi:hypothetical protein
MVVWRLLYGLGYLYRLHAPATRVTRNANSEPMETLSSWLLCILAWPNLHQFNNRRRLDRAAAAQT